MSETKQLRKITAAYCGSFDPITRGHMDVIKRGAKLCHRLVIGIGNNPHKKYLFSLNERLKLVQSAVIDSLNGAEEMDVVVKAYDGATVEFAEDHNADFIIKGLRGAADYAYEEKMAIINHRLKSDIDTIFIFTDNHLRDVSSSVAKEIAMIGAPQEKLDHYLTENVKQALLKKFEGVARGADDHENG